MSSPHARRAQRATFETFAAVALLALALIPLGCRARTLPGSMAAPTARAFDFSRDTYGYTNNNMWLYEFGPGREVRVMKSRLENVDHGQRCTIMARTVRQFFYEAVFDPSLPEEPAETVRIRIRDVIDRNPRNQGMSPDPIVIPGFADLREFSLAHEQLLKDELSGRWVGYWQRGNWRMIFPFSASHQRGTTEDLIADLAHGHLPLVHVVTFPDIQINHTLLLLDYEENAAEITFTLYDPNQSTARRKLVFDRGSATFRYDKTDYFAGGAASVYRVYDGYLY